MGIMTASGRSVGLVSRRWINHEKRAAPCWVRVYRIAAARRASPPPWSQYIPTVNDGVRSDYALLVQSRRVATTVASVKRSWPIIGATTCDSSRTLRAPGRWKQVCRPNDLPLCLIYLFIYLFIYLTFANIDSKHSKNIGLQDNQAEAR